MLTTWIKAGRYIHIRIATSIDVMGDSIYIKFSGQELDPILKAHEPKAYKKIVDYLKEEIKG